MAIFSRKQNPPAYGNSRDYKPFLRVDFLRRCAYCERPEEALGGKDHFEVEHFKPRSRFPQLTFTYGNLYYACRGCNGHKSETWPTETQLARGMRFADPCEEDPYRRHLSEAADGTVKGTTPCGAYTAAHIRLHREDVSKWRRLRAQARVDLPIFEDIAILLEQRRSATSGAERLELEQQLGAVHRYIEEAKLRFAIS